jgi:hypothetical protein
MTAQIVHVGSGLFLSEIVILVHVISGFVGMTIWKSKRGNPSGGLFLGLLLGVLGVAILAIARPGTREVEKAARSQGRVACSHCGELIMSEARVCPHCRREVAAAPVARS